jgi:hypothetical protein
MDFKGQRGIRAAWANGNSGEWNRSEGRLKPVGEPRLLPRVAELKQTRCRGRQVRPMAWREPAGALAIRCAEIRPVDDSLFAKRMFGLGSPWDTLKLSGSSGQ